MTMPRSLDIWHVRCPHCEKEWFASIPALGILASAVIRLIKAHTRCVYCDRPGTQIIVPPQATGGEADVR